jgi:RsiW-degrading membrane proteinase PrsW (M82 family)
LKLQLFLCAAFGAAWAVALARGAPEGTVRSAARGLLGGLVAIAAAWGGYALLERAGMGVSWDEVTIGGSGGIATAASIGLVEESAKLFAMALVSVRMRQASRGTAVRTVLAVSAGFATFESMIVLAGAEPAVLVLRALLAPVAHAALSAPLGLALAGGRRGLGRVAPALLLSAALHAASDLALATPGVGRIGYAAVLAAPAVFLHLRARLTGRVLDLRFGPARPRLGGIPTA